MGKGTIGGKIVLEGEKEYREALRGIKTEQANLRSEMKLASSEFKNSQNSINALQTKHKILSKQLQAQAQAVKVYQQALAGSAQKEADAAKKVEELKAKLASAESEMKDMSEDSETTAEAFDKQAKAIEDLESELATAEKDYAKAAQQTTKYETSLNYANATLNDLDNELQLNERYLKEAEMSADGCATSIDEFGNEVKAAETKASTFGDVLKANIASDLILSAIRKLSTAIIDAGKASIEAGMNFEASMDNVAALSGATGSAYDALEEKARQLGSSTMYSASEAADALGYMALAGWDANQMLAGSEPILNLAAAANMDLAQASDIVTDYLTAFGLTAEDTAEFTDMLAYAMSHSNTNVEQLGEAYKNCAATANSLGYSVNDVTAVLMTMANAGVKGGEAGTGLSSIMTRLATNTKGCADELEKYGVHVYDAQGNMNELSTILEGMSDVWRTLSDQEQANLAKMVAGTSQYSKLQTIMAGLSESAEAGGQSFGDYSEALKNCTGSAKEMADVMQDNLKGKITILKSALEGLQISFYDVFDDSLKEVVEGATEAIGDFEQSISSGDMNASLSKMADSLQGFLQSAINVGSEALPVMIDGLAWILDHADALIAGAVGLTTAYIGIAKIAPVIKALQVSWVEYQAAAEGATISQWLLNGAMSANPAMLLVTAIAAVTTALIAYDIASNASYDATSETTKATQDLVASAKELNKTYADGAQERQSATASFEAESTTINSLISELDGLQNKSSLSASEQARMRQIVDELNTALPELNLAIDEETGALNKSTSELELNTAAIMENARIAAAREDLITIAENQYEAEKTLADLEAQLALQQEDLAAATDNYNESVTGLSSTYGEVSAGVNDYQIALVRSQQATDELNTQIDETKNTIAGYEEEYANLTDYLSDTGMIDGASDALGGLGDTATDTGADISAMATEAETSIADMYTEMADKITQQTSLFDQFDASIELTTTDLLANMQSQIDGITNWSANIESLADRGINQGLLQYLADMGPEGAGYVALFASMTDEELESASSMFEETATLTSDAATSIVDSYTQAGEDAVAGFASADTSLATELFGDMGELSLEALREALDEHSPSKKTKEIGEYAVEGMNQGLKGKQNTVQSTATNLARVILQTFKAGTNYNQYFQLGAYMMQGLAAGINSGASSVIRAAVSTASQAYAQSKSALDIHSPSKKFAYLGEMSVAGYVQGFEQAADKLQIQSVIENALPESSMGTSTEPVKTAQAVPGNTYIINGITYDDGTNVASAIEQLIHAAKIERRA